MKLATLSKTISQAEKINVKSKKVLSKWKIQPPLQIVVNNYETKLACIYKNHLTILDIGTSKCVSIHLKCQSVMFNIRSNKSETLVIAYESSIQILSEKLQLIQKHQRADSKHKAKFFITNYKRGLIGVVSSHCVQIYNNEFQHLKCLSPKTTILCADFVSSDSQLLVLQSTGRLTGYALMSLDIVFTFNIQVLKSQNWSMLTTDNFSVIKGDGYGLYINNSKRKNSFNYYPLNVNNVKKFMNNSILLLRDGSLNLMNIQLEEISMKSLIQNQDILNFQVISEKKLLITKKQGIQIRCIEGAKLKQSAKYIRNNIQQQQLEMTKEKLIIKLKKNLGCDQSQLKRQIIHPLILQIPYDIHKFKHLLSQSYLVFKDIQNPNVLESIKVLYQIDTKISMKRQKQLQKVLKKLEAIYRDPIKITEVLLYFLNLHSQMFEVQRNSQVKNYLQKNIPSLNKIICVNNREQLFQFIFSLSRNLLVDVLPNNLWLRFWDFMIANIELSKNLYLNYIAGILRSIQFAGLNKNKLIQKMSSLTIQNVEMAQKYADLNLKRMKQLDADIYKTQLQHLWKPSQLDNNLTQQKQKLDQLTQRLEQRVRKYNQNPTEKIQTSKNDSEKQIQNVFFHNDMIQLKLRNITKRSN